MAQDKIEVFQDRAGEWRWRRRAPNGNIVGDSGEGYTEKDDAIKAASREAGSGRVGSIVTVDEPFLPPTDEDDTEEADDGAIS